MKRNPANYAKYKKVCKEIWDERPHQCEDCGNPIGVYDDESGEEVPQVHNFAHGPRGRRSEENCLDKTNIFLKCMRCHSNNDGHQNVSEDNPVDNMVTRMRAGRKESKKQPKKKIEKNWGLLGEPWKPPKRGEKKEKKKKFEKIWGATAPPRKIEKGKKASTKKIQPITSRFYSPKKK